MVGQPIATIRKLLKTMSRMALLVEVAADRFFLRAALLELGVMAQDLGAPPPRPRRSRRLNSAIGPARAAMSASRFSNISIDAV